MNSLAGLAGAMYQFAGATRAMSTITAVDNKLPVDSKPAVEGKPPKYNKYAKFALKELPIGDTKYDYQGMLKQESMSKYPNPHVMRIKPTLKTRLYNAAHFGLVSCLVALGAFTLFEVFRGTSYIYSAAAEVKRQRALLEAAAEDDE